MDAVDPPPKGKTPVDRFIRKQLIFFVAAVLLFTKAITYFFGWDWLSALLASLWVAYPLLGLAFVCFFGIIALVGQACIELWRVRLRSKKGRAARERKRQRLLKAPSATSPPAAATKESSA